MSAKVVQDITDENGRCLIIEEDGVFYYIGYDGSKNEVGRKWWVKMANQDDTAKFRQMVRDVIGEHEHAGDTNEPWYKLGYREPRT